MSADRVSVPREFIEFVRNAPVASGVCCCGDDMEKHADPMSCGHSPVDQWHHSLNLWLEEIAAVKPPVLRSETELEALPAHPLAKWKTGLALGLHRIHWSSGGTSLAAIGMQSDGRRWIAPCNWTQPSLEPEAGAWGEIDHTDLLFPYPEAGE